MHQLVNCATTLHQLLRPPHSRLSAFPAPPPCISLYTLLLSLCISLCTLSTPPYINQLRYPPHTAAVALHQLVFPPDAVIQFISSYTLHSLPCIRLYALSTPLVHYISLYALPTPPLYCISPFVLPTPLCNASACTLSPRCNSSACTSSPCRALYNTLTSRRHHYTASACRPSPRHRAVHRRIRLF